MSYILDALRRADAERERDPARGIHAQPAVVPAAPARRAWPWIAAVAGVAALAAFYLLFPRPAPVAPRPVVSAPVATPAPQLEPPAAPAIVPVATSVSPPAPPPMVASVNPPPPPAVAPERAVAKAATVAAPAPAASAPVAAAAAKPASQPANVAAAPTASPAPAAPAADRVLLFAELPADVQRELPKLQISGGVYSENAAQRMLIVGGQVMGEGAQLAPGVVLEQIRPRTAVLKFRSYRYSVSY